MVVLRHQPRSPGGTIGAEIVLYQIQRWVNGLDKHTCSFTHLPWLTSIYLYVFSPSRESPAKKSDILRLDMSGRFAINIVDNLIVVHHQASKVQCRTLSLCSLHVPLIIALPVMYLSLWVYSPDDVGVWHQPGWGDGGSDHISPASTISKANQTF